jgi:hypothetical protein
MHTYVHLRSCVHADFVYILCVYDVPVYSYVSILCMRIYVHMCMHRKHICICTRKILLDHKIYVGSIALCYLNNGVIHADPCSAWLCRCMRLEQSKIMAHFVLKCNKEYYLSLCWPHSQHQNQQHISTHNEVRDVRFANTSAGSAEIRLFWRFLPRHKQGESAARSQTVLYQQTKVASINASHMTDIDQVYAEEQHLAAHHHSQAGQRSLSCKHAWRQCWDLVVIKTTAQPHVRSEHNLVLYLWGPCT